MTSILNDTKRKRKTLTLEQKEAQKIYLQKYYKKHRERILKREQLNYFKRKLAILQ